MVDPKITSPAKPAEWDVPDEGGQRIDAPDSSFQDDHVGARTEAERAARSRAALDRGVQEAPRDVLVERERVNRATAFLPARDDAQTRELRRRDAADARAGAAETASIQARSRGLDSDQLEGLLAAQLTKLAALPEASPGSPHAAARRRQAALADAEARATLRDLAAVAMAAGAPGLAPEPQRTFRRLLRRIRRWPRRVPPGRAPETDEDFDALLAWAYAPPPLDPDVEHELGPS